MASSDKRPPRTIDDTERAREAPEIETAALTTAAVTMFLGVMAAAAEAAKRPFEPGRPEIDAQPVPPQHAADQAAAQSFETPQPPQGDGAGVSAADTAGPHAAASGEFAPLFGDLASHQDQTTTADAASNMADAGAESQSAQRTWQFLDDDGASAASQVTPAAHDTALHDSDPNGINGMMHDAMSQLSSAMGNLGSDLQQLFSSVSFPDPAQLGSTINDLAQNALSGPAMAADSLVANVFESAAAQSLPSAVHGGFGVFDTAGAVPLDLAPAPLQLGFLGQAQDGHDPHDGAFSALGVHAF